MKFRVFPAMLLCIVAGAAAAQVTPNGFEGSNCDLNAFTPVLTSSGALAYWNNPTCPAGADGSSPAPEVKAPMEDYYDDMPDESYENGSYPPLRD